jgi:hypothetical protein
MKFIYSILLALIAFGTCWMAYEQHRANAGVFVPFPSPQHYRLAHASSSVIPARLPCWRARNPGGEDAGPFAAAKRG